jgi:hypothetical protein
LALVGCEKPAPIVTYTVPTEIPEQLRIGNDRMLGVMLPKGDDVWFFKVTGPEKAVASIQPDFRKFVRELQFSDGVPDLEELPEGWRRGGEKPMRFATIDVETPSKQLGISISKLGRQEDWDEQVKSNVNRWRDQLGLPPSDAKWARGEQIEIAVADSTPIWVDLVGRPGTSGSAMLPPLATRSRPSAADVNSTSAQDADRSAQAMPPDERLKFRRPEGWRDGPMTSMRMAAFSMGPEDSPAELTVIPAGGDLRGNVARWLSQVRQGKVPDELVDQALADAKKVDVDGRVGQRFYLSGEDDAAGTAIDATVVPIEGGMSLFVKMTGPAKTVSQQSEAIASFLDSLELNL